MRKKHSFLYVLLVTVVCLSLILTFVACSDPEGDEEETTETTGLLLTNGDFTSVSSETFPQTPSNWTGAAGSTSGSNITPTDSASLASGVIDTTATVYQRNRNIWDSLANPGTKGQDAKVLMIYNKKSTVYQYTLSNISIAQNKYYKVSFWVKTVDVEGSGAYIFVKGDAYSRQERINTNGNWQKFVTYIEGSSIKSSTISLVVSLGEGDLSMSPATGYAFFDNITMVEQTAAEYTAATDAEAQAISKYSMKLPDAEFENANPSSSQPFTPSAYTGQRSQGADGTYAPSGSGDVVRGIIDLDRSSAGIGNDDLTAASGATNRMLYINNKTKTAYGFRSNAMIRFESNAFTKISVMVRTNIDDVKNDPNGNNGTGRGVTLRLTTGASDENDRIEITNINTNGVWEEYSIFVESNKLRSRDLYIEFWLGQGGETSADYNLRTKGYAYFDQLKMTSVTETDFNNAKAASEGDKKITAQSLTTAAGDIIEVPNGNFDNGLAGWKKMDLPDLASSLSDVSVVDVTDVNFATRYGFANPLSPSASFSNVLAINNKGLTATSVRYNGGNNALKTLTALPNTYYRLSMWVKTVDVVEGKGVTVSLLSHDPTITDAENDDDYFVVEQSLSNINSLSYDSESDKNNNNYVELVFYVQGDILDATNYIIEISLGSGSRYSASTLVSGKAFLSNVTLEKVASSEYTSATSGTAVSKVSFVNTPTSSVTNGGFSQINISDTLSRYENEGYDNDTNPAFGDDGLLANAFGSPTSWTVGTSTVLANLYAGVFNTGSTAQQNLLNISDMSAFFNGYTEASDKEKKNILVLKTKDASASGYLHVSTAPSVCGCDCTNCISQGYCDGNCDNSGDDSSAHGKCSCLHKQFSGFLSEPIGYTSPSFSLVKDSFYVASVWAKADSGVTASIKLKASNALDRVISFVGDGTWHKYSFFVETGLSDISTTMVLSLGNTNPDITDTNVSGAVYFDWTSFAKITEEQFNYSVENITALQAQHVYTTDSFDNISTASTDTALGTLGDWTFSSLDSDASTAADAVLAGVFDKNTDDADLLGSDTADLPQAVYDAIFNDSTHDRVLVINNRKANAYQAQNSSSKSLAVDSYYRISMQVFTWGFAEGKGASVSMKLNNLTYSFGKGSEVVNTSTYNGDQEVVGEWKTYTFYIRTAPKTAISGVYFNFSVGAAGEDNRLVGKLFVDNVTTDKITEDEFVAGAPVVTKDGTVTGEVTEVKYDKTNTYRIVFTENDITAEQPVDGTGDNDNGLLWLYISSGIIGALIIIVVIVFFIKKYYRPKKKNVKKLAPYDAKKNKGSNAIAHKDKFKDKD